MATRRKASAGAKRALASARLLALDVDGTLTDGSIRYSGRGRADEIATFHVQDGIALRWLERVGVRVAWISGRGSRAVRARARELGVRELHLHVVDKGACLERIQERLRIPPRLTVAMGDDLPDLPLARRAILFAAPANAVPEVRVRADLVTRARGGAGAVRELARALLVARGAWARIVAEHAR